LGAHIEEWRVVEEAEESEPSVVIEGEYQFKEPASGDTKVDEM
jgi:hypothetical protein